MPENTTFGEKINYKKNVDNYAMTHIHVNVLKLDMYAAKMNHISTGGYQY